LTRTSGADFLSFRLPKVTAKTERRQGEVQIQYHHTLLEIVEVGVEFTDSLFTPSCGSKSITL